ncbi:MAG: DUF167 domain-containing protein [bacterium]|nr:DUF167 domain-containing protein [bacterium]
MKLTVKLQPRARNNEIIGVKEGMVWVRVTAPPVDNQANGALIACLAKKLDIPKSRIRIVTGTQSRIKVIEIDGITDLELYAKLKGK